jgi:hypothetical protein
LRVLSRPNPALSALALCLFLRDGVDGDYDFVGLSSINAVMPDPHRLKAVNAIFCTSGALCNNQVPQRNITSEESATITAQVTAIRSYFNTLLTSHLLGRKSDTERQALYH